MYIYIYTSIIPPCPDRKGFFLLLLRYQQGLDIAAHLPSGVVEEDPTEVEGAHPGWGNSLGVWMAQNWAFLGSKLVILATKHGIWDTCIYIYTCIHT